jgi:hypothetical protein
MDGILTLLAILGVLAVLVRLGRSLLRVLGRGAEALVASGLATQHARRGDLTSLAEARELESRARRRRLRAVGSTAVWIGVLTLPQVTPWSRAVYAALSVLWLIPRQRS